MKILHICTYDFGGAATAAIRVHKSLVKAGLDSKMLVLKKSTDNDLITDYFANNKIKILFDKVKKKSKLLQPTNFYQFLILKKHKKDFEIFSFAETPYKNLANHPLVAACDVVHLHWVAFFLDYTSFFKTISKPIVWTLHDMNPFLGTYHYTGDEVRNKGNLFLQDLNAKQYAIKFNAISSFPAAKMVIVAPSIWMYNEVKKSSMLNRFEVNHIPTGVDPQIFNVKDKAVVKKRIGVDPNKIAILFVAEHLHNYRKGFDFIIQLFKNENLKAKVELVAVGNAKAMKNIAGIKFLGKIKSEEEISNIYGAADIFLLPSREDNLPNVMMESLACGTPVVAFNIGGMKDIVKNGENGFLANEMNALALQNALLACIKHIPLFDRSKIAANIHNNYCFNIHANNYTQVYQKLLN